MEGILRVTPEKLISTSEGFRGTGGQIRNLTQNMLDLVKAMNSFWQGEASTAYLTKFQSLSDDMQKMDRMINEHVQDLQDMAKQYQTAEKINIETSNALASDIIQ